MTFHFDLLSIILLISIAQGIFVFSVLCFRAGKESRGVALAAIVLALIWLQVEFLSVRQTFNVPFNLFYGSRFGAWLLVGPLVYLFTSIGNHRPRNIAAHFIPFLVITLIIPLATADDLSYQQVHYGMLSAFYGFKTKVSFLQYIYSGIFVFQFVHLGAYLWWSFREARGYEKSVKSSYSNVQHAEIKWLQLFIITFGLVLAACSVFLLYTYKTHYYVREFDYVYVVPFGIITYLVSYRLSDTKWLQPPLPPSSKYEKSGLKEHDAGEYHLRLLKYMQDNKPYLDNELRLRVLAEALSIPEAHLSQVINEKEQLTFFDFVNKYRAEEAKSLMDSGKNKSLKEVGYQAGFNNRTSFTNAFKKFKGMTPAQYLKSGEVK